MGTKRLRGDQAPDDTYLVRWRKISIGITALLDRIRRVHTGVVLRRLAYARSRGILAALLDEVQSPTRPLPRPL